MNALTARMLAKIAAERLRQEQLKATGRFTHTCADSWVSDPERLAILAEEFGEVARRVCDRDDVIGLREELIQVAAVAVAWSERITEDLECG